MTHRKLSVAALALAAALTMPACSGADSAAPASSAAPAASSSSASSSTAAPASLDRSQCQDPAFQADHTEFCSNVGDTTQGPATSTASFPGTGLQARITSVKLAPADATRPGKPGETTLVTVTTELKNTGTETFVFTAGNSVTEMLLHGANLSEATSWAVTLGGRTDLPAQLVPGSATTTASQFTAPASVPLTFAFNPNANALPTYTFTDIQTLAS